MLDTDLILEQRRKANEQIQKGLYGDSIEKSVDDGMFKSEGSRGGKVIGHTKSGKAIYEGHSATYLGKKAAVTKVNKEVTGATSYNVEYFDSEGKNRTKVSNIHENDDALQIHHPSKHISDLSTKEKHTAAEKMGVEGHEKMTGKELDKKLVDKNVDQELEKFKAKKSGAKGNNPHEKGTLEYHEHEADNTSNGPKERDSHRNEAMKLRAQSNKKKSGKENHKYITEASTGQHLVQTDYGIVQYNGEEMKEIYGGVNKLKGIDGKHKEVNNKYSNKKDQYLGKHPDGDHWVKHSSGTVSRYNNEEMSEVYGDNWNSKDIKKSDPDTLNKAYEILGLNINGKQ